MILQQFKIHYLIFSAAKRLSAPWGGSVDISGDENKSDSSLARGFLSGKFKSDCGKSFKDVFGENTPLEYECPENIKLLKRFENIAYNRGITVAQRSLAWLMSHTVLI